MKKIVVAGVLSMLAVTASDAQTPSIANKLRVAQASLTCGIAPIPPVGCRVGACVCDQYGRNCQWTFVCR